MCMLTSCQTPVDLDLFCRQHLHILRSSKLVRSCARRTSATNLEKVYQKRCTDLLLLRGHDLPNSLVLTGVKQLSNCGYMVCQPGHWWRYVKHSSPLRSESLTISRTYQLHHNVHYLHLLLASLQSARIRSQNPALCGLLPTLLRLDRFGLDLRLGLRLWLHLLSAVGRFQLLLTIHHAAIHSLALCDLEIVEEDEICQAS